MINRRNFIKVITGFVGGVFAGFVPKVESKSLLRTEAEHAAVLAEAKRKQNIMFGGQRVGKSEKAIGLDRKLNKEMCKINCFRCDTVITLEGELYPGRRVKCRCGSVYCCMCWDSPVETKRSENLLIVNDTYF